MGVGRRALRGRQELEKALGEALEAAERERAKLAAVIEAIGDPVSIQHPDFTVIYQNRAHRELTGSHVGSRCHEAYRGQPEVCGDCHLVKAFGDGEVHRSELELELRGSRRWVEIAASPLKDAAGELIAGIQLWRDVTEQKLLEKAARDETAVVAGLNAALIQQAHELNQANRDLKAFSHAISHDLRTPLTRISSAGQALEECGSKLDADARFFIKTINDGCLQLEALLESLLVLSRVTELPMVKEPVDLSRLAQEKARQLQVGEPDRRVGFDIAPGLKVEGDPNLFRILVDNLIGNAWKYTSHLNEAQIEFGSFCGKEGDPVFFLRDNGAGFDGCGADRLFKPFHRLHSSQQFPGNGLGLATVLRVIHRHNGRIWGEGKPGSGATFYFTVGK